jgi:hypothetical protein
MAGLSVVNPRDSLIEAVCATLEPLTHPDGLFCKHVWRVRSWKRQRGVAPPPDLALLAVLSLAAEDMREGEGHSANNYYDRLLPLFGYSTKPARDRLARAYRACSQELWGALNGWLEGFDGERGLPTAYATTHAHVGLPMSQALVRATDRDGMTELFAELDLPPRSDMPRVEMELHLADWIGREASNSLRLLWRSSEARARIVECARQLLQAWDGTETVTQAKDRPRRLQLTALLRSFPTVRLELNIVGSDVGRPSVGVGEIEVAGDKADAPALTLAVAAGARWRLQDPGEVSPNDLVEGRLRVRRDHAQFERRPRRLIPLRKDDLLQAYVEAERLPLGEPSLVLCRDDLADQVECALQAIARQGFRVARSLTGCPNGWTLFSGVQVLGDLPERNPLTGQQWRVELNLLQPMTSSQVSLEGGLRLPGRLRTFSALAAPELTVATGSQGSLRAEMRFADALPVSPPIAEHTTPHQTMIWPLAPIGLPDGDYELTVSLLRHQGALELELETLRFRLRSGDTVAQYNDLSPQLTRCFADAPAAVVTATSGAEGPRLIGAELVDFDVIGPLPGSQTDLLPPWYLARQTPPRKPLLAQTRLSLPSVGSHDCFITGAHYINLPTFDGRSRGGTIMGICRDCGLLKRFPTHLRVPPAKVSAGTGPKPAPRFTPTDVVAVPEQTGVSVGVAFDGLCQTVAGPRTALEQIALQVEPSQLFADRFLRSLETLGHIEVQRDLATLTAKTFRVAPAQLVQLTNGGFVAIGQRGRSFEAILTQRVEELGGAVDHTLLDGAPDRIRISSLDIDAAELVAARVSEELGRPVTVVPDGARRLAAVLPSLSAVIARRPRQALAGARVVQRWDVELARWTPASDTASPGAYHLMTSSPVYVLRDAQDIRDGTMVCGDARLVKHAAAARSGAAMIGYAKDTETLYMPLGAELPLLYSRAAALAAGKLPIDDPKQRIVYYQSVTPELASQLMALLTT